MLLSSLQEAGVVDAAELSKFIELFRDAVQLWHQLSGHLFVFLCGSCRVFALRGRELGFAGSGAVLESAEDIDLVFMHLFQLSHGELMNKVLFIPLSPAALAATTLRRGFVFTEKLFDLFVLEVLV